jgi:hypothetical protein
VISRYLVITLAVGAAAFRLSEGAWVETTGLAALAAGLIILQLSPRRPGLKPFAWVAFSVTAVTMIVVFVRMR